MKDIYKFIVENATSRKIEKDTAVQLLRMLKSEDTGSHDIAIIGMAFRLPGACSTEALWNNIRSGVDCVGGFPDSRRRDIDTYLRLSGLDESRIRYTDGAYIEEIDKFDYPFFKFSPKEASLMDPNQRIFLETVWHAVEDAGYSMKSLAGSSTGIYVGFANGFKNYGRIVDDIGVSSLSIAINGNFPALIPSRISYLLDLKGPSMLVDTACSSSLVAVDLACKAIKSGECEMAIASGIRLQVVPVEDDDLRMGVESSDGRTRAFDYHSDGAGIGEGVAAILLKPLSKALKDRDNIYAVIKGSAVNQDGTTIGITAPNPAAQSQVIMKAWEDAQIDPETIAFIQTHGTGTRLGDPIEIKGIQKAFRNYTQKKQFCAVASVKANIGHLFECSGIVSLITAVLALKNREIPPSINFNRPNQEIDFGQSPVYVNTRLRKWEANSFPRRCGVSSFGMSGTNCHVVLEEAPAVTREDNPGSPQANVLALSAKSENSLQQLIREYVRFLKDEGSCLDILDICYTANTGRVHYNHRLAVLFRDRKELEEKLERLVIGNPGNDKLKASDTPALKYLEDVCDLYVKGAEVDWNELYANVSPRRVSLPVYPFERIRCWIEADTVDVRYDAACEKPGACGLYYGIGWKPEKTDGVRPGKSVEDGAVLVLTGEGFLGEAVARRLESEGREVIRVHLRDGYRKTDDGRYCVGSAQEDYHRLVESIGEKKLSRIIHLFSADKEREINSFEELYGSQVRGVYSLLYLTRAVLGGNIKGNIEIILVAENANEVTGLEKRIRPENATLFGLGKVIGQEYGHIRCRCVDIDEYAGVDEIVSQEYRENICAYRNGVRYVEEFKEISLDEIADSKVEIKEEGVYVITGGTGGIGLEMARHLASKNRVKLALISRTGMPEREGWGEILSSGQDSKLCRKIKAIEELEAQGSEVMCCSADVSVMDDIKPVIDGLRSRYGRINGIIHSAGVAGAGYIIRKEEDKFNKVFNPKVYGTWILDSLTAQDDPDFFMLFSSGTTITGEAGQGDYVAGNAYLDSYSAYGKKNGKRFKTVNWVSWKETGMSVEYGINVDAIFKAVPTSQAMDAFDKVLNKNITRVLIGELNMEDEYISILAALPVRLSQKLSALVENRKRQLEDGVVSVKGKDMAVISNGRISILPAGKNRVTRREGGSKEVRLTGKTDEIYTEIEKKVAGIYSEILGYDEINIHESFFELGGDSVLLTKMHLLMEKEFPGKVKITDLFAYTSIDKLSRYIRSQGEKESEKIRDAGAAKENPDGDIAIIGISARLPGARDIEEFWGNILGGVDCIGKFPETRQRDVESYLKYVNMGWDFKYTDGAYLDEIDKFDYKFFKLSPREASLMDPYQRLFLQTVWETIEDAGYGGGKISGTRTGVYVGYASNFKDSYHKMIYEIEPSSLPVSMAGNITALLPGRISYLADLKGPSMVIDTACSSSLVSLHQACKAIKLGECEMAIAGGLRVNMLPLDSEYLKVGIEASDGRTRTYDDSADGSGAGEGIVAMLVKPLNKAITDRDNIYAVIKGSAINQDGTSIGLTAPNPGAQEDVITRAWEDAGINPETLSYLEVHGTATKLGDPIEIEGLRRAFERYTNKKQFCAVGSVKTNLGHLYECAGITGVLKAVLALANKEIPPVINFNRPNKGIDFSQSPVYVNSKAQKWKTEGKRRRCGVSAFGLSGTNCHMVLEEAPELPAEKGASLPQIFTLSAKSREALMELVESFRVYLGGKSSGCHHHDVCYTVNTGRGHYTHRMALIIQDMDSLKARLEELSACGFESAAGYYGEHRVVSPNKQLKAANELTEKEKNELTVKANEKIGEFVAGGKTGTKLLEDICSLYIAGADIDWEEPYRNETVRKVRLPAYQFERIRCWIDIPEAAADDSIEDNLYHVLGWRRKDINEDSLRETSRGTVLIFKDADGLADDIGDSLKAAGKEVVKVKIGEGFEETGRDAYTIGETESHYERLVESIKSRRLSGIIHMAAMSGTGHMDDLKSLECSQRKGVYSLFYLTRALVKSGIGENIDIVLISDHVNEVTGEETRINCASASLFGLGKVVGQEYGNLACRCVDIDENTSKEDIIKELGVKGKGYIAAYRKGKRYVEEFRREPVGEAADVKTQIKDQGVYLIAGGTGGIGVEIARYLASKARVNLALVSRSKVPAREAWDSILSSGQDKRICKLIEAVRDMESRGSSIEYYSADVSNIRDISAVADDLRGRFGRINGVIHSAGVAGAGYLIRKEESVFDSVLHPKVYGAWVLDEVTKSDNLDFFVLFSSAASITGEAGQGDYVAANSYLDSYAAYRNRKGKRTQTINWVSWKDAGMSVEFGINVDTIFKAIPASQAVNSFDEILGKDVSRVITGQVNYDSEFISVLDQLPFMLSDELWRIAEKRKKQIKQGVILNNGHEMAIVEDGRLMLLPKGKKPLSVREKNSSEVHLKGREDGSYTRVEKEVAQIFGQVLGFDELDIHESFFELGGDSILAMRIAYNINKLMEIKLGVAEILKNHTIKDLSAFIQDTYLSKEDGQAGYPVLQPVEEKEYYPLSSAQKRMYVMNQMDDTTTSYNIPLVLMVEGELDRAKFENTIQALVRRHETLRTSFEFMDGKYVQRVHKNVDFNIVCKRIEEGEIKRAIDAFIRPFDLSKAPLMRVGLMVLAEKKHLLLIDTHHIISDGTSIDILAREFIVLYEGNRLPDLRIQYRDFSVWQDKLFDSGIIKQQEDYWLGIFSNQIPVLELPTDYPRPPVKSFDGGVIYFEADIWLSRKLSDIAAQTGTTLYMVLMSAYYVILSKCSAQEDIVVGSPISGRHLADLENVIGAFINTLPFRNYPGKHKTFREFLDEVRANCIKAYENQDYQYEEMINGLEIRRDSSRNPLFDVMFVSKTSALDKVDMDGLRFSAYGFENCISKLDILLEMAEKDGEISFKLEYCSKLFKRETMERFIADYLSILAAVADNPDATLGDIEVESCKLLAESFDVEEVEFSI